MRRWLLAGILILLLPWAMSLIWMRAGTQPGVTGNGIVGAGAVKDRAAVAGEAEAGAPATDPARASATDPAGAPATDPPRTPATDPAGTPATDRDAADASATIRRRILLERDGISTYMDLEDYLPGAVICQIDPRYHLEALKCQTVIVRTYICRLMAGRGEIREEELDLDYLGTGKSPVSAAGTGTPLERKEQMAEGLERCRQAAEETAGVAMQYDSRYILPLFHAVSAGRTRKGEEDYPYLQPVDSRWDMEAADYSRTFEWSKDKFAEAVSSIPDAQPVTPDQLPDQIQTVKKDDSGYVLQMKVGAKTYSGEELQRALTLPSSCFSLEGADNLISAVVKGSGHGYGLSQAGAEGMALEGWGYQDILNYYYKNISFTAE